MVDHRTFGIEPERLSQRLNILHEDGLKPRLAAGGMTNLRAFRHRRKPFLARVG